MNASQNQVLVPRMSFSRNACRAAMRPSLIVDVAKKATVTPTWRLGSRQRGPASLIKA
ncbi:hypothetical protein D9M71_255350 [compost metagenome]